MDCKIATLSVDPVDSHEKWLEDVITIAEGKIKVRFPIIADPNRDISTAYGMIDPWNSDKQELPLTIRYVNKLKSADLEVVSSLTSLFFRFLSESRCVFIINPENKLMLSLNYPACVGVSYIYFLLIAVKTRKESLTSLFLSHSVTWTRLCVVLKRFNSATKSR